MPCEHCEMLVNNFTRDEHLKKDCKAVCEFCKEKIKYTELKVGKDLFIFIPSSFYSLIISVNMQSVSTGRCFTRLIII